MDFELKAIFTIIIDIRIFMKKLVRNINEGTNKTKGYNAARMEAINIRLLFALVLVISLVICKIAKFIKKFSKNKYSATTYKYIPPIII